MNRKRDSRKVEILFLGIFVAAISVVAGFHEPWHDEAQAWMIARDASVWEIIFQIPHTEGHPPLWHLLLAVFAKSGAPYELSLKGISVVISSVSAGLVLFYSPFPKWIRRIIPFTFFFFYQYGVISRPYCMMLLAFLLLAICYPERNEKTGRFALALGFLCLTSAYGIVFAGGICMVWLWEMWRGKNILLFLRGFVGDRRFWALAALLVEAVLLILLMLPEEGTYTGALYSKNGMVFKSLFVFIAMPVEALAGQCVMSYGSLDNISYHLPSFGVEVGIGVVLWIMILYYGRQKKAIGLWLLPVLLYDSFAVSVYLFIHHIGIILMYLLFWMWVCEQKKEHLQPPVFIDKLWGQMQKKDREMLIRLGKVLPCLMLIVPLWWTVSASILEINEDYYFGKKAVSFLRETELMDLNVLCEWRIGHDMDGEEYNDSNNVDPIIGMMPYMTEQEIGHLIQFADGQPHYSTNITAMTEENQENFRIWKKKGVPDVLIGSCGLEEVYDDEVDYSDYQPVKEIPLNYIWKNLSNRQYLFIYVRNDLLDKYNLKSLIGQDGNHYINNRVYSR